MCLRICRVTARLRIFLSADCDGELRVGASQRRAPVPGGGLLEDVSDGGVVEEISELLEKSQDPDERRAGLRAYRQDRLHRRTGIETIDLVSIDIRITWLI